MSENESKNDDTENLKNYGIEDEGPYGCGPCKSSKFACFDNVGFFTVMLSIAVTIQSGVTHGLIPISLTSIEKRFELESWMTGLFFVFYEAGFISVSLYVSYVLKWKVSTISGFSMLTLGIGCLLLSLPHFFTGLYEYKDGDGSTDICLAEDLGVHSSITNDKRQTFWRHYINTYLLF